MAKKKKKEYNQGIVTLDNSGNVTTVQKSQDYKTNYAPKKEVNKPSVGSTIKGSIKKAANTLGTGAELVLKGATKSIENTLDEMVKMLPKETLHKRFVAVKLLENDERFENLNSYKIKKVTCGDREMSRYESIGSFYT